MASATTYRPVDGLRYEMQQVYGSGKSGEFPDDKDYPFIFQHIESLMREQVHGEVVTGAALQGNGLLNDHGKEHIDMVIHRATQILGERVRELRGYEIFLLLLAIHFHDVGNITGRDRHEEKILDVMNTLGSALSLDRPSRSRVCLIAMSHSGLRDGDKDTIASVPETEYLQGVKIRPAALTAILRFADEISDDHTRAARFLYQSGQVPRENQVFHDYSNCLQSPAVDGNALVLSYDIPWDKAVKESSMIDQHAEGGIRCIFLYDEILGRLEKCMLELEYCRKYSQGFIGITSIQASISVSKPTSMNPVFTDKIRLRLSGYPELALDKMWEIAPVVDTGEKLKALIQTR